MRQGTCPVCGRDAETGRRGGRDAFQVLCTKCGPYIVTGTAAAMLPSRLDADPLASARASHAIRRQTSEDDWFEINSGNLDPLTLEPLPGVAVQRNNALAWMRSCAREETPFECVDVADSDALASVIGAKDAFAAGKIVTLLESQGYLEVTEDGSLVSLTASAWLSDDRSEETALETEKLAGDRALISEASEQNQSLKKTRGHCPRCGGERNATILKEHKEHFEEDDIPVWFQEDFAILKCCGCDENFVRKQTFFSEDEEYDYHPVTGETVSHIPPKRLIGQHQ